MATVTGYTVDGAENAIDNAVGERPSQWGAVGNGIANDLTPLRNTFAAALASGKHVDLEGKTYSIGGGLLTIQAGVTVDGRGGSNAGLAYGGSIIKCTQSNDGVWLRGAGCRLFGVTIDGNNVATNPLKIGGTSAGDAGTSPMLVDVTVMQAASGGKGLHISASQNGTVVGCNLLNNGGIPLYISDHTGGWSFVRLESTGGEERNVHIIDSGNLLFTQCLFERALDTVLSSVYIEGTVWFPTIKFDHTTFASGGIAVSGGLRYLVEHIASGTVEFSSCAFAGITNEIAIRGGNGITAPVIAINGITYFTGAGMLAFLDYDSSTVVDLDGEVRGQVAGLTTGPIPLRTVTSPVANIGRYRLSADYVYRTSSVYTASASLVNGEIFPQYERLIDGTQKLGPGNLAADTIWARNGVASIYVTGGVETSKDLKTPRVRYTRQVFTLSADGVVTADLAAGSFLMIQLNGFNLTGLVLNNGVLAQDVMILIKQGAVTTTIALPLLASNYLWAGGDSNVPQIPATALTWMSIRLTLTENGYWQEVSRASSAATSTTTPVWPAATSVFAGVRYLLPTGGIGFSATTRTTAATFTAAERDLWTFLPGGHYEALTATGAGTWKCPPGITKLRCALRGAGGQGGGGGSALSSGGIANQVGGGGGGIGNGIEFEETVTAGTSYTTALGIGGSAAGVGGAVNSNPGTAGSNGGDTTIIIGGITYTAKGGSGGAPGLANSAAGAGGGAPGSTTITLATPFFLPGYGGAGINTGGVGSVPNGPSGGGGGSCGTATLGGTGGQAQTAPGQAISTISTHTGTAAGAVGTTATIPGSGGGGGGAGAPGGAGANAGAAAPGLIEFRF